MLLVYWGRTDILSTETSVDALYMQEYPLYTVQYMQYTKLPHLYVKIDFILNFSLLPPCKLLPL